MKPTIRQQGISCWPTLNLNYWACTKNYSTTILNTFEKASGGKIKYNEIHKIKNWISRESAKKNNNTNFAVTRNPYERCKSMYKDMVLVNSSKSNSLRNFLPNKKIQDNSFYDFINCIHKIKDEDLIDVHILSQSWFIHHKEFYCKENIIIKTDELEKRWPFNEIEFLELKLNASNNISINIDKQIESLIYERYEEDFYNFNYRRMQI